MNYQLHQIQPDETSDRKKRVAAYVRVSTEEQAKNGYGLDAQKASLLSYIRSAESAEGWEFDPSAHMFVDEGFSGSLESRPAFDRLKALIEEGRIDVVVVNSFDRLFRNVKLCLGFLDDLCVGRTEIRSVIESNIDPSSENGRMFLSISQTLSENERIRIANRTMAGKRMKASLGFSVSGTVPFGYKRGPDKKIVIFEPEASTIRRMFDLFANKGKTQSEIARILTEEKAPTRSDLDGRARKKDMNGYGAWPQEAVSQYLRETTYAGEGYFGKTVRKKYPGGVYKTEKRPKSEWIPQPYPPIVDRDTFDRVQSMLQSRANAPRKKHCFRKYLLATLVECEVCGKKYCGYASGKDTANYRCGGGAYRKRSERPCKNSQISGAKLEGFVWRIVKSLLSEPKKFSKEFERISNTGERLASYVSELDAVERELSEAGRRVKDAFDMKLSAESEVSRKACDDIIKGIEGNIRRLSERREEFEGLIRTEKERLSATNNLESLSRHYRKNLEAIGGHFETKERLLRTIVKRVGVSESKVSVLFRFSDPKSPGTGSDGDLIRMEYDRGSLK